MYTDVLHRIEINFCSNLTELNLILCRLNRKSINFHRLLCTSYYTYIIYKLHRKYTYFYKKLYKMNRKYFCADCIEKSKNCDNFCAHFSAP